MNRLYIKLLGSALILMNVVSCDFLDLKPKFSYTGSDMLKTYDNAVAAVNGIYVNLLESPDEYGGRMFVGLSARAGITEWKGVDKEIYFEEMYPRTGTADPAKDLWFQLSKGINYANFAINGISNMPADAFDVETKRTALVAEARLCRAWFNIYQLHSFAQWWETDENKYGILFRDKVSELTNLNLARLTVGESYAKIFEDLDYAIENCPTLDEFKTNKKMSKEYAKVLKAKLLLIRGTSIKRDVGSDLSTALTIVNELLGKLPKDWVIEPNMSTMYLNSFDSKENLFVKYNADWKTTDRNGGFIYGYELGYMPSEEKNGVKNSNGDPLPYDEEKVDAGIASRVLDFMKLDPRWKITTSIQENPETWDKGSRYAVSKLYRDGYNNKPKCDLKFNVYYFRLYELYLMQAELVLRTTNDYNRAMSLLNELRATRTTPVLPALTAASQEIASKLLYQEYINEFYYENGSDYFASLRFKSPDGDTYVEFNKKSAGVKMSWIKQIYPIPSEEMNNKLMIQNEGY